MLIDMSPRCDSIMLIWNDIGWYMCHLISRPLSGIWIAVVIISFTSILIYEALFDVAKYLKSFEATTITSIEPESTITATESKEPKSFDVRSSSMSASTKTAIESTTRSMESSADVSTEPSFVL
ncbi:hypothetical protein ANCCAN_06436 [Ancylostoma caninum]|uniref:Uncharacterized protein n=1 Tax=Ancylostoma caninum TaxID=29170 RepID=A0A368GT42_ANCCA|nr:hypothetical protein ANCCAN_06436 [Ancylostoma caninum]